MEFQGFGQGTKVRISWVLVPTKEVRIAQPHLRAPLRELIAMLLLDSQRFAEELNGTFELSSID